MIGLGFFLQSKIWMTFFFSEAHQSLRGPGLFPSCWSAIVTLSASGSLIFWSQHGCLSSRKHALTSQHPKIVNEKSLSGLSFYQAVSWVFIFCGQRQAGCDVEMDSQTGSGPCSLWSFLSSLACGDQR